MEDRNRVLFLDMDGVLCTHRAHVGQESRSVPMDALDREAVGLLNVLVLKFPDLKFVLSSTWRHHRDRQWMESHLRKFGWRGQFHEDWSTKRLFPRKLSLPVLRGEEVAEWLSRHPEVDGYVILDDNSDFIDGQLLVVTDPYNGLLYEHYKEAYVFLNYAQRRADYAV